MKRTFTTIMPDKIGAFYTASKIFTTLGLNITRVSYNKAIDVHTLFLEAEGEKAALDMAETELKAIGYLPSRLPSGGVIVLEFLLPDHPGAVQPVLELIQRFHFNISYISSQQDGSPKQAFRMGLFAEDARDVSLFLQQAAGLCSVKVIEYDPGSISLDNTVFYVSFAGRIAELLELSDEDKQALIVNSNLVMEMLTRRNSPPYKTFDYIGKFAEQLHAFRNEAFQPRITRHELAEGITAVLIEPPCGSNLCLIETQGRLVCVDSGFPCYREETLLCLRSLFPGFDTMPKDLLLTHADVDHCGLTDRFDRVFLSRKCLDNFLDEHSGRNNLREQNPVHAPYIRISKILSGYRDIPTQNMHVIGGSSDPIHGLMELIGSVNIGELSFQVYEAAGGHVKGEVIFVEERLRIAFTGDILLNLKGFTPQQTAFNRLAPYLMTSVDTDPKLALREREYIPHLLSSGSWLIFGGHGAPMTLTADGAPD